MINFNNKPYKVVTETEFIELLKSIGIGFCGFKYISSLEIEMFEDKTDSSFSVEKDGTIKIHNLNYEWEN